MPTTTISRCGGGSGGGSFLEETLASNPDAMWPLNEPSGTIANDATGNGHYAGTATTTPTWAAIVPPKAIGAPHFVPGQGFITSALVYNPNLAGDFTAAVWFRTHTDSFGTIFGTQVHGGTATGWDLTNSGALSAPPSKFQVVIGTGVGVALIPADNIYNIDTWYWLAVTHSGTLWTLYVNAVAQTATYSGAYDSGAARPVWIGYDNSGSFGMIDGYLSYATLWATRALTATELATIYLAP